MSDEFLWPPVGDGSGLARDETIFPQELQLALRNRGMPLEALRYDLTPTGLHYLLIHFDIPAPASDWSLKVAGLVSRPLRLSLEEIRKHPEVTQTVTMECAGNGRALLRPRPISQPWLVEAIGTARWTGVALADVLHQAGVDAGAREVVFSGADRGVQGSEIQDYQRSLPLSEALRPEVLLAYEMNGEPLPPQHGHPLRLVVPGWYGMTNVKWLKQIEVVDRPFHGYQMERTYRYAQGPDEPGDPVDRIRVRSLMIPPGIPDFLTRVRLLEPGTVEIQGRAWAGDRRVVRVEFSSDGGESWTAGQLEPQPAPFTWQRWACPWNASPGRYTLCVRASDEAGNTQPLEQPWNYQGMGNNMVQHVDVIVKE